MTPSAGEGGAARSIERVVEAVAIRGDAAVRPQLHALELLVEDEVDDARNRVRTVSGRCAAGHDLHASHQPLGKSVDVDEPGDRRADRAAPVEQHQRADFAQVAQIERVDACRTRAQRKSGVGWPRAARQGRELIDEVGDVVRRGRILDFLERDDGEGVGDSNPLRTIRVPVTTMSPSTWRAPASLSAACSEVTSAWPGASSAVGGTVCAAAGAARPAAIVSAIMLDSVERRDSRRRSSRSPILYPPRMSCDAVVAAIDRHLSPPADHRPSALLARTAPDRPGG